MDGAPSARERSQRPGKDRKPKKIAKENTTYTSSLELMGRQARWRGKAKQNRPGRTVQHSLNV
ncbi:uncharacterized protein N7500_007040 [Penicillium coprophilum]|uniref:uncharacterized protein n=1 Tax=Penicillium coprophilum TaxID=36646 RepID=UPI002395EF43|nr:uncharacterized protein N7500_007040 [Penicillium coprophilum]KAJ5165210.1 hypothetical protein N7500_007040 [Penicillium coprophilum]